MRVHAVKGIILSGTEGCIHPRLMGVEIAQVGIQLIPAANAELFPEAQMRGIVAARSVVGGYGAFVDAAGIVALCTAAMYGSFDPQTAALRIFRHKTAADVADLAAAVRPIVEIGSVTAMSVFDEGAKCPCPRFRALCTRPT